MKQRCIIQTHWTISLHGHVNDGAMFHLWFNFREADRDGWFVESLVVVVNHCFMLFVGTNGLLSDIVIR